MEVVKESISYRQETFSSGMRFDLAHIGLFSLSGMVDGIYTFNPGTVQK